jgi:hypothetical protein
MYWVCGEKRNAHTILVGKPEGRRPLVRTIRKWWWIILKWILSTQAGMLWIGFIWLNIGANGELL